MPIKFFSITLALSLAFSAHLFRLPTAYGQAGEITIVAIGDSLMAGHNLPLGEGFPEQLEIRLEADGYQINMVSAGVSGDTSSGGRARMEWVLGGVSGKPDLVIVELGANDALRGVEPSITRGNIDFMVGRLTERGIPVMIMGMVAPINLGAEYQQEFDSIFPDIASKYGADLYPFFLEGVAAIPTLNLSDGIHPNEAGIAEMVSRIAPRVASILDRIGQASGQ